MKTAKIIFWIATILLILWEGVMPLGSLLFAPEQATVGTRPLGYPDYFAHALIVCKALGVLAIAAPGVRATLREWAYAGLTFNLLFAAYSHACVDKNIGFVAMPLVILVVLFVSYVYRRKLEMGREPQLAV